MKSKTDRRIRPTLNKNTLIFVLLIVLLQGIAAIHNYQAPGTLDAFATAKNEKPEKAEEAAKPPLLLDKANLLSKSEEKALMKKQKEIEKRYNYQVVILTVDSIGKKTPEAFADDYYDDNGYGYGKNKDGMLYLVDMKERDYHISTTGYGTKAFTDYGIEYVGDMSSSYLSDGEYYGCFSTYLDNVDLFLQEAENGKPYDVGHRVEEAEKTAKPPLLLDKANLLSGSEEKALMKKQKEIEKRYNYQAVILTVNSIGEKTPEAFADDYYDENGYGYGKNKDGMIYLINMGERDYHISTTGYGIKAFTDYGIEYVGDMSLSYLSGGEYYDCFSTYLDNVDLFLQEAENGTPYDVGHPVDEILTWPLVALSPVVFFLLGLLVAFVVNLDAKSKMQPVEPESLANRYLRGDSVKFSVKEDTFLYKTRKKEKIDDNNNNKKGGSTTHVGSSGTTHGGGGGKF